MRRHEACVWDGCLYVSDDAVLDVHLLFDGRSFTKPRVPLCNTHLREFQRSGRMNLRSEFLLAPVVRR